jgi:hypothetical protein
MNHFIAARNPPRGFPARDFCLRFYYTARAVAEPKVLKPYGVCNNSLAKMLA